MKFLIFTLFLSSQYYNTLYEPSRFGPRLRGLQYITNAIMRHQSVDFQVEGCDPLTSSVIQSAPCDFSL